MTLDRLEIRFGLVGTFVAVIAVYSYLPVYLAMFAASMATITVVTRSGPISSNSRMDPAAM